jgi:hypothetical protein
VPLPQDLRDAMEAARLREAAEADRERRRDFYRTAIECLAWCAFGLVCMGWGFHTTDALLGRVAFLVGIGAGNAGVIFAILGWYRRGERRGDR